MLELACLCGRVRVTVDARPDHINECNCLLCGKSGARWAYYRPSQVAVAGEPHFYVREDKADPAARVQFCPTCGSTTHFTLTEEAIARFGSAIVGVNMRLADDRDLAGVELRFPDGRAWRGEGPFGHVREAQLIGGPAFG